MSYPAGKSSILCSLSCHPRSVRLYLIIPHYLIKGRTVEKNNVQEMECVFECLLQHLSETFSIKRTQQHVIIPYIGIHVQYPLAASYHTVHRHSCTVPLAACNHTINRHSCTVTQAACYHTVNRYSCTVPLRGMLSYRT